MGEAVMTKLLHISASPRGAGSESLALAERFLAGFGDVRPEVGVERWDLWDGSLPAFGPAAVEAKMAVFAGADPEGDAAAAWRTARRAFERFDAAELYLFSVPMWNHSVPYVLKQFIDVVSQPGMVFGFDPENGYTGLLRGKRAAVLYTGAVWGPDLDERFGVDLVGPYFETWLRWAGVDDIATMSFRPNLVTVDADSAREAAHAEAFALGRTFTPAPVAL
jgi:FMN-dependent NADH-azoreductase